MNIGTWQDSGIDEIHLIDAEGNEKILPGYVCGHCSDHVVLDPNRKRPRTKCSRCGSLICEMRPACLQECLPIHSIMPGDKLLPRVQALLDGAQTSEEIDRLLIKV